MPFETSNKGRCSSLGTLEIIQPITNQNKTYKPTTLDELKQNPFPVFPHELHTTGAEVDTCKHCKLHKTGIQRLSLACTPEREKLREGGW